MNLPVMNLPELRAAIDALLVAYPAAAALPVRVEGCDCAPLGGIDVVDRDGEGSVWAVMLTRSVMHE